MPIRVVFIQDTSSSSVESNSHQHNRGVIFLLRDSKSNPRVFGWVKEGLTWTRPMITQIMENYRHNYQDHLVNTCQRVFAQWLLHPHSPGAHKKCLRTKMLISFLKSARPKLWPAEIQPDDGSISAGCVCGQRSDAFAWVMPQITHTMESSPLSEIGVFPVGGNIL